LNLAGSRTRTMREFTTFEALLKPITNELVEASVKDFDSDYYSKTFKTYDHLLVLLYAQLHDLKCLRDLEIAFNSQKELLGLLHCGSVSRSTLSDANERAFARKYFNPPLPNPLPHAMRGGEGI
jgi:hypothetical protein